MNAIRRIADVKSGSIKIDLPDDFHAKKVEIIIALARDLWLACLAHQVIPRATYEPVDDVRETKSQ